MTTFWRVLDSEIAFPSRWATIRRDRVELPDGTETDYFLAVRPHVALVLALTPDDRAVLVTQYKHGAGTRTLELPGGTFTDEEDPAQAAARELREETGYVCPDGLHLVGTFHDDASENINRTSTRTPVLHRPMAGSPSVRCPRTFTGTRLGCPAHRSRSGVSGPHPLHQSRSGPAGHQPDEPYWSPH